MNSVWVSIIMQQIYRYMDEHDVYTMTASEIEEVLKDVLG